VRSVLNETKSIGMPAPLKILIVDDEPVARRVLREEVESLACAQVIDEADNGTSALEKIEEHRPDIVLLDLQMPEMGGLEVVRQLRGSQHVPAIVIVTAYDKFAIQAFEAGAIDYLLKPVRAERLAVSLERARRLTNHEALERVAHLQEIAEPSTSPRIRKIVGRIGREYFLLRTDEIYAFQAEGELVFIITGARRYIATQTLQVLQERLADTNFRRIHRNALINADQIRKMSTLSSQRWLITLNNDMEFVVSKRQAHSVRELLHW
jgi:DNA-binding LytR/AlgR family response regulator